MGARITRQKAHVTMSLDFYSSFVFISHSRVPPRYWKLFSSIKIIVEDSIQQNCTTSPHAPNRKARYGQITYVSGAPRWKVSIKVYGRSEFDLRCDFFKLKKSPLRSPYHDSNISHKEMLKNCNVPHGICL